MVFSGALDGFRETIEGRIQMEIDRPLEMVKELRTLEEYNTAIATTGKLVVFDFYATWCGPCTRIKPHFEQFAYDYPDVLFVKVDVDANYEARQSANI
jgi:thiol-disulfide isomerase/thioredoxin